MTMNFSSINPITQYLADKNAFTQSNALRAILQSQQAQAAMNQARAAVLPALLQQAQQEGQQTIQENADKLKYLPSLFGNQVNEGNLRIAQLKQALSENPQLLKAKLSLLNAQTQADEAPTYQTSLGKMVGDYMQAAGRYGTQSPLAQALFAQIKSMQQGQNIQQPIGVNGSEMIPGAIVGAGNAPITQTSLKKTFSPGTNAGAVQSIGAPISSYTTQGSTYLNPVTGYAMSVPTQENVSFAQQGLLGEEAADAVINDLYKRIPPELGGIGGFLKRGLGQVDQILGINNPAYSNYLAAIHSEIPAAAEQLLKAYGLRPTNQQTKMVEGQIMPLPTDTPASYGNRLDLTRASLAIRSGQYKNILKSGVPLQTDSKGMPTIASLANFFRNRRLGIGMGASNVADNINKSVGENISIPTFNSKADLNQWVQSASPNELAAFKKIRGFK